MTAKLCRFAIWRCSILIGGQGQGCPSNEAQAGRPKLSENSVALTAERTRWLQDGKADNPTFKK